ncbi:MAG TPA: hypothetical protein VGP25_01475 [Gemmatimonadaceae bacterium]|nr:hypothetical protein [Gemmatimonadaceae bacterium]
MVLAACAALAGCGEPTAARGGSLVVAMAAPTAAATRYPSDNAEWVLVPVDVTLRNAGTSTIRVESCGPTAEHESSAGWQAALGVLCDAVIPGYFQMTPGSERTLTAHLAGHLSGPGAPQQLDQVFAGRYRLVYRYGAGDTRILLEARSAPFDVTE